MIRNLFFDLDDTLLDFRKSEHDALAETLRAAGIPVTEALLARYAEINAGYWRRLERREVTRDELKVLRFRDLFVEIGAGGADPTAICAAYEMQLGQQHHLIAGASEALRELHKQYRLFAASNGTGSIQRARLAGAGIADLFDGLFISEELGAEKPSAAFFDACFARFPELKRSETAMIGDSLTSDIAGGQAAGLLTVWFNPTHAPTPTSIRPDREVERLCEVGG
ncbi:MAG TPA: noncanonical pyrimidine nucleotidase, YjjG family [Clostridiales bacterium]|nr:noncanonical pyrimidine nucleotidase, YjjG family [Clostridiales bacterium]